MGIRQNNPEVAITSIERQDIFLSIYIDGGNTGISIINFVGEKEIIANGEIESLFLEKIENLIGKTIQVYTVLVRTNHESRKIAVFDNFKNGYPDSNQLCVDIESPGSSAQLLRTYTFKK